MSVKSLSKPQTRPRVSADTDDHSRDAGFVVPEPDGVESGVPFDEAANRADSAGPGARRAPAEGIRGSGAVPLGDGGSGRGLSIRHKLNLGLGLLTAIIAVLGAVAISTLRDVNAIGVDVADRQARVAKAAEEIAATVYLIRDAEKDFLLLQEQEALDRVTRYIAKVRGQLEKAAAVVGDVQMDGGDTVGTRLITIGDAVDNYEARFAAQVKDVRGAHTSLEQRTATNHTNRSGLAGQIEGGIDRIHRLGLDYWTRVAEQVGSETLSTGLMLESIEKDLLGVGIQVANFFGSLNVAFADSARAGIADVLVKIDKLRGQSIDARTQEGMEELRKTLQTYSALLRESANQLLDAAKQKDVIDSRIQSQERGLREVGDSVIGLAEKLSAHSWQTIASDSNHLIATGINAQWLLGAVVIGGIALGLFVLIAVPRPIIEGLNQLLTGAQQVARGNLTIPIQVASNDEIGKLAATFNHMRENLFALVQRIQRASVQLSSSINEIQAAATQQASSAAEQASAVNQLSASLNEMSQSAGTLVSSSESVTRNVDEIATTVNDGNAKSALTLASMDAIGVSTRQTADRIKALNDKMDDINEAVSVISMVADQTTLLSLNASIEANKAGEMGKGFSVVANEIRRLSDRSIDSATGISGMVRDIQRATESSAVAMDKSSEEIRHGVGLVKASTESLGTIDGSMERIQEQMSLIVESVRAQAESSRMVQTTSTELLAAANMVSKAASQTQSVTYELNAMATQLASAVAAFRV